jgi:hypothetical protein
MKKRLKIVEEFSKPKNIFKKIDRNIFFESYDNGSNGRVCLRKVCPITKKIYNNAWSLSYYTYNEAIYKAKQDLDYINKRLEIGLPLKYYTIKYWITPTKFILI